MTKHYDRYRRHGVLPEDYRQFLTICKGACCICGANAPFRSGDNSAKFPDLFIDHSHATGLCRGLLCSHCNSALGYLGDSLGRLETAEAYLLSQPALKATELRPDAPQKTRRPDLPLAPRGCKGVAITDARIALIQDYYGPYTLRELGAYFGHSPVALREALASRGVPIQPRGTLYSGGRLGVAVAKRYSMGVQQYKELQQRCSGVCMCCKSTPEPTSKFPDLVVDHDHATGDVRGLICWKCNLGLGNLADSLPLIRAAKAYLLLPPLGHLCRYSSPIPAVGLLPAGLRETKAVRDNHIAEAYVRLGSMNKVHKELKLHYQTVRRALVRLNKLSDVPHLTPLHPSPRRLVSPSGSIPQVGST